MICRVKNGKSYFYRARRVGLRVHTDYLGAGFSGQVIAELEAAAKKRTKDRLDRERADQARLQDADAPLDRFAAASEFLVKACLFGAGFHLHARSEWRRRRRNRHG
jgi:hypothetical protein